MRAKPLFHPATVFARAEEVIEYLQSFHAHCCICSGPVLALGRRAGMSVFTESIGW
jgi:hypothetical protein